MELWPVLWRGLVAEFRKFDGFTKKRLHMQERVKRCAKGFDTFFMNTCVKFIHLVPLLFQSVLSLLKLLLIRALSLLYWQQSCILCVVYMPPCFGIRCSIFDSSPFLLSWKYVSHGTPSFSSHLLLLLYHC